MCKKVSKIVENIYKNTMYFIKKRVDTLTYLVYNDLIAKNITMEEI